MKATAAQILINDILPKELRDYKRIITKKEIKSILNEVARKYPNQYKEIVSKLSNIGQDIAYLKGNHITLNDFILPVNIKPILEKADKFLSPKIPDKDVVSNFANLQKKIDDKTLKIALKHNNSLAEQIVSGARGKPQQLASTVSSPTLYADNFGKPIRLTIKNSFSEGLTPFEYWASTYGTRKGVISTKFATPIGGYFGKQLGYISGDLVVTEDDCGTNNGLSSDVNDSELIGRLLAVPILHYKKDTILDNRILSELKKKKIKKIIVRSPITCEAESGVCKKCYGYNENGRFPSLGDNVGTNSASAGSETATQGAMREKHTGGQVSSAGKKGLELIQQLVKIPKVFRGGAVVSKIDGKVNKIEKAAQGGWNIFVNDMPHYTLPEYEPIVKVGDTIEAGLPLTKGIVNPSDVTKLRGIGEGRKHLFESLRKAYLDDGQKLNRVHLEDIARSMLVYAKVKDNKFLDDNVPGDIITLEKFKKYYKPKPILVNTKDANGKYLAKSYLHYNSGTLIRPNIIKDLKEHNYNQIEVTGEEPPFDPIMIRLDDVPEFNPNWLQSLYSVHLKKKIIGSTQQAKSAPLHSVNFIPAYIRGEIKTEGVNY